MPAHTTRDLLPLPVDSDLAAILRRQGLATDSWLADGVHHLNLLGGGGRPSPRADQVSTSQCKVLSHLANLYAEVAVQECEWSPTSAFSSLMGSSSGYTDDVVLAAGGYAVFQRGARLALPSIPAGKK
eukprot:3865522-Amphidinium_carterae.1